MIGDYTDPVYIEDTSSMKHEYEMARIQEQMKTMRVATQAVPVSINDRLAVRREKLEANLKGIHEELENIKELQAKLAADDQLEYLIRTLLEI